MSRTDTGIKAPALSVESQDASVERSAPVRSQCLLEKTRPPLGREEGGSVSCKEGGGTERPVRVLDKTCRRHLQARETKLVIVCCYLVLLREKPSTRSPHRISVMPGPGSLLRSGTYSGCRATRLLVMVEKETLWFDRLISFSV